MVDARDALPLISEPPLQQLGVLASVDVIAFAAGLRRHTDHRGGDFTIDRRTLILRASTLVLDALNAVTAEVLPAAIDAKVCERKAIEQKALLIQRTFAAQHRRRQWAKLPQDSREVQARAEATRPPSVQAGAEVAHPPAKVGAERVLLRTTQMGAELAPPLPAQSAAEMVRLRPAQADAKEAPLSVPSWQASAKAGHLRREHIGATTPTGSASSEVKSAAAACAGAGEAAAIVQGAWRRASAREREPTGSLTGCGESGDASAPGSAWGATLFGRGEGETLARSGTNSATAALAATAETPAPAPIRANQIPPLALSKVASRASGGRRPADAALPSQNLP